MHSSLSSFTVFAKRCNHIFSTTIDTVSEKITSINSILNTNANIQTNS